MRWYRRLGAFAGMVGLFWCGGCSNSAEEPDSQARVPEDAVIGDVLVGKSDVTVDRVAPVEIVDSSLDVPRIEATPFDLVSTVGQPCTSGEDCPTGLCVDTAAGPVCTDFCVSECPEGWECRGTSLFGADLVFICVPLYWQICKVCETDMDCKSDAGVCVDMGPEGLRCAVKCDAGVECPTGFSCEDKDGAKLCGPDSGSCTCRTADDEGTTRKCEVVNETGTCTGEQACLGTGGWADCDGPEPKVEECNGEDEDCDGMADNGFPDTDLDGAANCVDDDDDGDEVLDDEDNCPFIPNEPQGDADQDGLGDVCDDDADGDGFAKGEDCDDLDDQVHPEADEACNLADDNCNGLTDEGFPDLDQDQLADCLDDDDDGDGEPDETDNCPVLANPAQGDLDEDGIGDLCDDDDDGDGEPDETDNCLLVSNPGQENADGDNLGDACDLDDDNDGLNDDADNCPLIANPGQENLDLDAMGDICDPDDDNDTHNDGADNCPAVSNPDQTDLDEDGLGNACDDDDDGDGVPDGADNCPLVANPMQEDTDEDELGDACDLDDDNDSILDEADNCPLIANTGQENCEDDDMGDACDPDDDNDGSPDEVDCGLCDASVYPGAMEACNGVDDNCNSITDEDVDEECHPFSCGGELGCMTHCNDEYPCVAGYFCDANDFDGNGKTDECLESQPAGTACTSDFECSDGYCGNGYCCGAKGEDCCAGDGDCAALSSPPVCDSPASCIGHRMDGYCNDANVCKAKQVAAHSGCAGSQCFAGKYCVGAAVHENRFCDGAGGCTSNGSQVQNCAGANPCCNYGCADGACNSAFSGTIECAYLCFLNPIVCLCF